MLSALAAALAALPALSSLAAVTGDGRPWAPVVRILPHPDQAGRVVAGIRGYGVVASRDGGASWERVAGELGPELRDVAREPSGRLLAAVGTRAYFLDDESGRWVPTGDEELPSAITSLAVVPERPGVLYAGTSKHAVWKSENGGAIWRRVFNGVALRAVGSLVVRAGEPETLHAVGTASDGCVVLPGEVPGAIYTSRDGGGEWYVSTPYSEVHVLTAAVIGDTLYYSTGSGLWVRRGSVWHGYGLEDERVDVVIADPFDPDRILAASHRLWEGPRSRIREYHPDWRQIGLGLPDDQGLTALAADPHHPGAFYAGTRFGAIYRSFDGGETWYEVLPPVTEP